jgi:hypothetical protein
MGGEGFFHRVALLIMVSGLGDLDDLIGNPVNETVLFRDPSRPKPRKGMFQWLGFSNPFVGISPADVLEEEVDLLQDFPVVLLPVEVIFPGA